MAKAAAIKQNPEKEVATEILATSIVAISDGIRKLRAGRLNDRALLLLIQDAAPSIGGRSGYGKISIKEIKAVLEGMESLEAAFVRKTSKAAQS